MGKSQNNQLGAVIGIMDKMAYKANKSWSFNIILIVIKATFWCLLLCLTINKHFRVIRNYALLL